jgi:5'-deoxynucleotidase YfbR-like HD superfamily hydrolase
VRLDKLFGLLSGLSGTDRFSNAKLIHRESVLEHLGSVVLMCYFITRELKDFSVGCVDEAGVLAKAAVHDVEEILVGDIPRTTKHSSSEAEEMFRRLEAVVMNKIVADLELSEASASWFLADHGMAKSGDEGLIVELADVLAVVYKLHEECVERGNLSLLSRATTCGNQLTKIVGRVNCTGWPMEAQDVILNLVVQARRILEEASRLGGGAFAIEEGRAAE